MHRIQNEQGTCKKKIVDHPRNNNETETHNYKRYDIVLNNSTRRRNNNMHPPTPYVYVHTFVDVFVCFLLFLNGETERGRYAMLVIDPGRYSQDHLVYLV